MRGVPSVVDSLDRGREFGDVGPSGGERLRSNRISRASFLVIVWAGHSAWLCSRLPHPAHPVSYNFFVPLNCCLAWGKPDIPMKARLKMSKHLLKLILEEVFCGGVADGAGVGGGALCVALR